MRVGHVEHKKNKTVNREIDTDYTVVQKMDGLSKDTKLSEKNWVKSRM